MLQPLSDRVVIEPLEAKDRTEGGILLPDSAQEKPHRGKVLAVGPGTEKGPVAVKAGDEVLYGNYAGHQVQHEGRDFLIMTEADILAKIVK